MKSARRMPAVISGLLLVFAACNTEDRRSVPVVIGPDAITVIGEDSLATTYIDVTDLGGSVAYLSSTEPFVTMIDTNGRVARQFGVPGEGPGDFRNPTSIDAVADTLYVWDVRVGAASMYDTVGRYLGRRRADANFGGVAPTTRMDYAGRPGLYRRLDSIAVTPAYTNGVSLPGEQRSYSLLAVNNLGAVLDTVWTSSLPASANAQVQGRPMHLVPIPLWARCSNARLVVYDPAMDITTYRTPTGTEVGRIESRADSVHITAEELRQYLTFHFRRLYMAAHLPEPSSLAEAVAEMVQQGKINGDYPSGFAGYTSILCNADNEVWLEEFSLQDSPQGYARTWIVLGGRSSKRSVTLPEGFRLMMLDGSRGYGTLMDSTTVEFPAWVELPQ